MNESDEKNECSEDRSVWKWRDTNTVTMKVLHVTLKATLCLLYSRMEVLQIPLEVPRGEMYPKALCV